MSETKRWHAGDFYDLVCACTDGKHNDHWVCSTAGLSGEYETGKETTALTALRDRIIAEHALALRAEQDDDWVFDTRDHGPEQTGEHAGFRSARGSKFICLKCDAAAAKELIARGWPRPAEQTANAALAEAVVVLTSQANDSRHSPEYRRGLHEALSWLANIEA